MFDSLTGNVKEYGRQLYFRDDRVFQFRKLQIQEESLIERRPSTDIVERGWMMFYKLMKRFDGYKKLRAGMVTICFGRDIVFDHFNQLEASEKPEKGKGIQKEFIKRIAEAKCYKHEQTAKPNPLADKFIIVVGSVMVMLGLAILIQIAVNRGGS